MDRLAHDALAALNVCLQRNGAAPLEELQASPPGISPVELALARSGFAEDVVYRSGQLRWWRSHGVQTHWTPPESVRNFISDWDSGKYPDLVAAGPF